MHPAEAALSIHRTQLNSLDMCLNRAKKWCCQLSNLHAVQQKSSLEFGPIFAAKEDEESIGKELKAIPSNLLELHFSKI